MPDIPNLPDEPTPEPTPEAMPQPEAVVDDAPATIAAAPEPADASAPGLAAPTIPELAPAACAARLAELFPALFTPGAAKPLKLRIQADIQARAPGIFTKKSLSIFLHRHTTSTAYLRALVASSQRVDLDGQPAGDVADEHRAAATAELERRRALHDERRAAERDAQRKVYEAQRKAEPALRAPQGARLPPPEAQRNPSDVPQRPPEALHRPAHAPRRPQDGNRRPPDARRRDQDAPRRPQDEQRRPHDPHRAAHAMSAHRPDDGGPPTAEDEARRERIALLRAYESSTLTRANFCVLKRMTEAQLEDLLTQARLDAPRREPAPQRPAAPSLRPEPESPLQRRGPRR